MNTVDYNNLEFYQSLGFKSGVEIHQQIFTERKLFCKCPAGKYSKNRDAEVLRHMRPTLSELGEYDGCALMEFKTKKEVVYQLNRESVCTYEMDDTPPFLVNQQGLDIAIEIALLLNCSIVDEMHISRKQYLDGSIPTGFQRTAVVGVNGWLPFKDRKIRISHICYEEDACRQVTNIGHCITFRTDRLGMPLIEVITMADMRTPQELADVVNEISRVIRTTGKVRRGLGSVRQDVNASIEGGSRVEIKGVPQICWIPRLLHNEALRQKELLDIKQLIVKRNINVNNLDAVKSDLTKIFSTTKSEAIKHNMTKGKMIGGIKLTGLALNLSKADGSGLGGILNHQTQPGKTFADEIAGRLRVIACLDIMPNFFHTDNYPSYDGSENDLALIKKALQIDKNDVGVIVWGPKKDVETALEEVRLRMIDAINGIPNETRQPFRNGLTDFERILPGPNRMYPDTDSPPTKITTERVNRIKEQMPESPLEKEKRYMKSGVSYYVARDLAVSDKALLAEKIIAKNKTIANLIAVTLTQQLRALKRKGIDVDKISDTALSELFELYTKGAFHKEAIPLLLEKLAADGSLGVNGIIKKMDISPIPESKYPEIVNSIIKDNKFSAYKNTPDITDKKTRFYTGKVMRKYRGRINASVLPEYIDPVV